MALSTYFNWDILQTLNQEMSFYHEAQPEALSLEQLLPPYSEENLFCPNTFLDPYYFDPTSFNFYPETTFPHLLPCTSSPYLLLSETASITEDNNFLPCPKRQKHCYFENQEYFPSLDRHFPANIFDGFASNPCSLTIEEIPEVYSFIDSVSNPQGDYFVGNNVGGDCEKKRNEKSVSPQSVAARERRRKITDKTQELGKLVPGGSKMNTAEMLHAGAKYVKFLQAQVGMLQLVQSHHKDEDKTSISTPSEEIGALLDSPSIQEKLYVDEKCIVPKEFVKTLINDAQIQTQPSIVKDLNQLTE